MSHGIIFKILHSFLQRPNRHSQFLSGNLIALAMKAGVFIGITMFGYGASGETIAQKVGQTITSSGTVQSKTEEIKQIDGAQPIEGLQLTVVDPFLDIHTGPGRGYPVTQVAEQGEQIVVMAKRANWYRVAKGSLSLLNSLKSEQRVLGWVSDRQLARTLEPSGLPVALPNTNHGDYLASAFRVGFNVGSNRGSNTYNLVGGYRINSWLGAELEWGKAFATTLDGYSRSFNIIVEPYRDFTVTPFISAGVGKQEWQKKIKLPGVGDILSDYQFYGVGINYYAGFNFLVRGELREVTTIGSIDSERNTEWRIGFNTFF